MLYFKTIEITGYDANHIEKGLRRASLKRTSSLDMVSSVSDIGTDKLFIGYEDKKGLTFTRIKSSLEKFLPKLIIRLFKEEPCAYKIRFAAPAALFFVGVICFFLLFIYAFFAGNISGEGLFYFTVFAVAYFLLIKFEIRLTTSRVDKALARESN